MDCQNRPSARHVIAKKKTTFSSMRRKLRNGVGAECSCLKRMLHSRPVIDAKYPNARHHERLEGLVCIRREKKTVNHREQVCVFFLHANFPDEEIYCVEGYCKVTKEGNQSDFFGSILS